MPIKRVVIDRANRVYQLPPDVLASVITDGRPSLIRRSQAIDLASFKWPAAFKKEKLPDADTLAPADSNLLGSLRQDLAEWYLKRHKVRLNPDTELFIGGGITHLVNLLTLCYVDNGDVAFVPNLGVPLYRAAVTSCGGEPIGYTISSKNDWVPQFDRVGTRLGMVARLLFINSPHNPTGVDLGEKDFTELVGLASRENILLVNDFAYASIPSRSPVSLLSVTGGKKVGVEIGNLSYLLGLPPIPLGYVAGHRDVINGLKQLPGRGQSFLPSYLVELARAGIRHFPSAQLRSMREYLQSAENSASQLTKALELEKCGRAGIPFVWARIESRGSSNSLARALYRRHRLLVVPGLSFGENGEGFLRLSLTAGAEAFEAAARRIERGRMKKDSKE